MATKRKPASSNPKCTVCRHPDRHVACASFDSIAVKFGTPEHPVHRASVHANCRDHLDEAARSSFLAEIPIALLVARAAKEGVGLLDYFGLIWSTVIQQMLVANGVNDGHRVATMAGRAVEVLRELGRVSGELRDVPRGA